MGGFRARLTTVGVHTAAILLIELMRILHRYNISDGGHMTAGDNGRTRIPKLCVRGGVDLS